MYICTEANVEIDANTRTSLILYKRSKNLGLKCNNYEVIIYLSNIWADLSRVWQPVWFRKCTQRYLRLRGTMPQLFSYVMAMG